MQDLALLVAQGKVPDMFVAGSFDNRHRMVQLADDGKIVMTMDAGLPGEDWE